MKLSYSIICIIIILLIHSVVLEDSEKFLYYAYGSNLLAKRIHINNPTAIFYGIAKLRDHRLDFITYSNTWNGAAATIVEDPGTDVWGALWLLNVIDMKHLDTQEGVDDDFYFAKNVTVVTPDGAALEARTYQQTIDPPKAPSCCIPSDRQPSNTYMEVILYGAFECRLPMSYIRYLFTFPTNNKVAIMSIRQNLGYPFNRTEPH